jgi:hypothetical protein
VRRFAIQALLSTRVTPHSALPENLAAPLPLTNGAVMRKALAIGLEAIEVPSLLWGLAAGEVSLALLLLGSDKLPSVLIRSLQLFLRF